MNGTRPVKVPRFFDLAVQHLRLIDNQSPPQMVRLHSHFALTFLQLGLERDLPRAGAPVLTIVKR